MPRAPLLIASLILLQSCAATGSAGCDAWRPILVAPDDALTPRTAAEILAHNRVGVALACWPDPRSP